MLTAAFGLIGLGVGVLFLLDLPVRGGSELQRGKTLWWQVGVFVGGTGSLILLSWARG